MKKTVILCGKGELAIRAAEWFRHSAEYRLELVVPVVPEPSWTRSLIDWCNANDVPYVQSGRCRDIPDVDQSHWNVDLVLSVFYERVFPSWFIPKPTRILNLHNSPLPRYRGLSPINWALKNRETTHGVTLHEVIGKIDAGPIVSQVLYNIYPEFDEVIDVYNRAIEYGYALLTQTIPMLARIQPTAQNEILASYYSENDRVQLGNRKDFTRALSALKSEQPEATITAEARAPGAVVRMPTGLTERSDSTMDDDSPMAAIKAGRRAAIDRT